MTGFAPDEYRARVVRAQAAMAEAGLAALLLTTEPDIRYFSGFLTRFWESPTRPWFLVVPAEGAPIAVIPTIGRALMETTWITDIRTWRAPDLEDDGISLLAATLAEHTPPNATIGLPMGMESHLRMPLSGFFALEKALGSRQLGPDGDLVRTLRMVKSEAEIAAIRAACGVADRAFARLPEILSVGRPLSTVFRDFQSLCLSEGADWVPYVAGAAAQGGYLDVISPATYAPLARGDVVMLDTGLIRAGYFCDFDRNVSMGPAPAHIRDAHARLIDATAAGFAVARAGVTPAALFYAMAAVASDGGAAEEAGRFGHGLGQQLTEWPSIIPADHTPLPAGTVLTLEPSVALPGGRLMVHEENIVLREDGAEWLSTPSGPALPEMPI
ncbi:Xaa-Pro dipeptidase [Roseivivax sp. THAF40]|uniref:M24 family metallopeptidase n=1 Tax=Roseivivax sp. THAF40 TaxID=2587858 RepID=UPI001268CDCD|nr:M24 family metallopeptidase [Roseivivax sp. THAF40]QFT48066.1 Xaa-Pro dipeptidase [Roseivivax sp. THAF40]